MKITCRNCDGEMETLEIKKFKIEQYMDGDYEAKVTELDNQTFLLFGERLGTVEIENTKISEVEWKIEKLEILIDFLNEEFRKSKEKDIGVVDLITCLALIKQDLRELASK